MKKFAHRKFNKLRVFHHFYAVFRLSTNIVYNYIHLVSMGINYIIGFYSKFGHMQGRFAGIKAVVIQSA